MAENNPNDWKKLTDDDLISQAIPDPNNPDVNVIALFSGKGS